MLVSSKAGSGGARGSVLGKMIHRHTGQAESPVSGERLAAQICEGQCCPSGGALAWERGR